MIQLMIVDDEPLFRDFLVNFIPWDDYGFSIVAEAKNGLEALELADIHQPDVVLTDINMPKMDGLEFADNLLKTAPNTSIVFITGHNEFDYARKAIRLGASDYILKPFEKEELILTLLKLKDNIHQTEQSITPENDEDSALIMPLLTSKIHHSNQNLLNKFKSMGFDKDDTNYILACLDIDHIDKTYSNQEEKMLWRFSVMNILKELIMDSEDIAKDDCHVFYDYEGNITCLYKCSVSSNPLIQVLNQLFEAVNKYLDFTVTIGVSSTCTGLEGIADGYNQALNALHNKYIMTTSQIIYYDSIPEANSDFTLFNAAFSEDLLALLRKKDMPSIEEKLNELYTRMKSEHISIDLSRIIQLGIINLLISYITQAGKSIDIVFGKNISVNDDFDKADTLDLQQEIITGLFKKTTDYFGSATTSRSQVIAEQGKDYIDSYYSKSDLTVQEIASAQFINQTYLRSMFKKSYGITVSDYLTKTRMEAAAGLLKEKTHRLADIADMVGYNDSSYFSKCFKKYYGMSPSQYEVNH